jgi:hypothetical protein
MLYSDDKGNQWQSKKTLQSLTALGFGRKPEACMIVMLFSVFSEKSLC